MLLRITSLSAEVVKGRYYYDPQDKIMVDTETGKVYGFTSLSSESILTEIDYVNGTVRPIKSVRIDDKEIAEQFDKIKKGYSIANWIQRMAGTLASWKRSTQS